MKKKIVIKSVAQPIVRSVVKNVIAVNGTEDTSTYALLNADGTSIKNTSGTEILTQ